MPVRFGRTLPLLAEFPLCLDKTLGSAVSLMRTWAGANRRWLGDFWRT